MPNLKITASEINKFAYCPYQWYYEKVYGVNEINELAKNRKIDAFAESNFEKGKRFHNIYHKKFKYKALILHYVKIAGLLIFLILVTIMYLVIRNVIS